jgi:HK97 family phage portal protein
VPDYVTDSGLVVTDHRHSRARESPPIDPRDHVPNGNLPSTVGPESTGGNVMYPEGGWHSEAWAGWPVDWHVPPPGDAWSGTGYGRHSDVWGKVSTVMSCVGLNARELASFPIYGMKGTVPFTLPSWATNPEPAIYSCWDEFMHAAVTALQLRGDVILYATGRYAPEVPGTPGRISRFTALNPDLVDVEWIAGRMVYTIGGAELDAADICHVRYLTWPGRPRGVSPIEWLGSSLTTSSTLERYAASLATRGGVPWAVLQSAKNLNSQQVLEAQSAWVAASLRRDGAPAVLGNAFELKPLSISPRDMALLELREFDERRICAAFGVPSFLVNVESASSMTYANVSQVYDGHWRQTLRPLAQLLANAWSAWLLPRGSRMEFNPDRYTQPPFAERVAGWATMFNMLDPRTGRRAMELDEVRSAERLATSPDVGVGVDPLPSEPSSTGARLTGATV